MPSAKPRAPISLLILASMTLPAGACVTARPIVTAPSACSSLVGPTLRANVPPVDLPGADANAGDLWVAFDGQTGRLDTANAYRRAVLEIVERCEARDQAAAERIQAPFWQFWRR